MNGRVLSNRFELNARLTYKCTGRARGDLKGLVHMMEHDRYLCAESFIHISDDWQPFTRTFLPAPNVERAELELVGENVFVDDLYLDGLGNQDYDILDMQSGYHPSGSK